MISRVTPRRDVRLPSLSYIPFSFNSTHTVEPSLRYSSISMVCALWGSLFPDFNNSICSMSVLLSCSREAGVTVFSIGICIASSTVYPLNWYTDGLKYKNLKLRSTIKITSDMFSAKRRYRSSLARSSCSTCLRSVMFRMMTRSAGFSW